VILIDANLLVYAIDADSPQHARAKSWLEATLSSDTHVGLVWIVILAFLRITTRSGILLNPLRPSAALAFVASWLEQAFVRPIGPGDNHSPILRNLLEASGTAGNLTSDAHLAALALEHGCTIASADNDFKRFAGITHINPLATG
jgi:toxin-antitoxin system PIN domain toxin